MANKLVRFIAGLALLQTSYFAVEANSAPSCAMKSAIEKLADQCMAVLDTQMPSKASLEAELKAIAAKDKSVKAKEFYVEPSSRTCSSATYSFPGERKLNPGEAIYLSVPKDMRNQSAATLLLDHRQDPNDGNNAKLNEEAATDSSSRPHDDSPGLTSFQFRMKDAPDKSAWRHYNGSWGGSGKFGAKFAQIGYSTEREAMEGIRSHGHTGVDSGDTSKAPLHLNAMRLVNVGSDPVYISAATVKLAPPPSSNIVEAIFTPGTKFEDFEKGIVSTYGGGESQSGKYPGAVELSGYSTKGPKLPSGWKYTDGEIRIPVAAGMKVNAIELSVGDMHDDGQPNKDGGIGTSGWATLSVGLKKSSGEFEPMIKGENVGKNGVMTGLPKDCGYITKSGDEVVIRANGDTLHIMGIRLHLDKTKK